MIKTPACAQGKHLESKAGLGNSKSTSNIDSIRKLTLTVNGKGGLLKSGEKLNHEISKIQKKIE